MVEEVSSPLPHFQQIQFSTEEIEGKEAVVAELAGEKIKMGTASEEGLLLKKVTVVLPDRTEKTYILKTLELVDKFGLSRKEIEELDAKTLGAVITERARKQLSRKTDLILSFEKVGIASKNAERLAEGILAKEKEWKEKFDGFREKYKARQGEDADTLYLSKKDTGLPLSLEMNRDGAIKVLLRSNVTGINKLKAGGTYKTVKTAYDINRDKVVALATVNLSKACRRPKEEQERIDSLQKELKYLRKYGGIHVSPITFHKAPNKKDSSVQETKATFTLELAAGTFKSIRGKSPKKQIALFSQVGAALKKMHADDMVHRDIKPENLLVISDKGYLCDFGAAGESDDMSAEDEGTQAYFAPEYRSRVDRKQKKYRKEADVWAFGSSIYVSLTGQIPPYIELTGRHFKFVDDQKLISQKLENSIENQELQNLLERMLTVDPEDRITMDEVVYQLERISEDLTINPQLTLIKNMNFI